MYEVGKVHIWQNLVNSAHCNGQETIVTSMPKKCIDPRTGEAALAQSTDTTGNSGYCVAAKPGQLRLKNPPSGQKKVMDQFKRPINTKTPEMA